MLNKFVYDLKKTNNFEHIQDEEHLENEDKFSGDLWKGNKVDLGKRIGIGYEEFCFSNGQNMFVLA